MMCGTWVFDMETLPNRTLFCAYNPDTSEWFDLWRHDDRSPARLSAFLQQVDATFIGFNNKSFDNVVASAFCAGRSELEMKRIANDLIVNRTFSRFAYTKYSLRQMITRSIDLIEVAPSFVGLKAYGARMHMPHLQDMPMAHDENLKPEHESALLGYCHNDVDTTVELLNRLESEIMLRIQMSRQYNVDMRSKSDTQMAEQAYISSLGLIRRENKIPKTVNYAPPSFLRFESRQLSSLLEAVCGTVFEINTATGHPLNPPFLGSTVLRFGSGSYQLGVGGIHSTHDKCVCHVAGEDSVICDIDAVSFYPSIILGCGFGPEQLGDRFVTEYRKLYERRLEAKRVGDKVTDATLKISLNGTFGKFASKYSVLYAPDLMLAVTLTGQLTLLMLIERLEAVGVETLSANTDGIAVRYDKALQPRIDAVVSEFEALTGFSFEHSQYRVLAMKDVNNYFAVKPDRSLKEKGIYSPLSLRKNPTAGVCATAVGQWLSNGISFLETIKNSPFCDFVSARNVTGGGKQGGLYLGKVVRWYQSTTTDLGPLVYAKNGNKVPKTDGARACMTILDKVTHPEDLDYAWYHREAVKIAVATGCRKYLTDAELELVIKPDKKLRSKKS